MNVVDKEQIIVHALATMVKPLGICVNHVLGYPKSCGILPYIADRLKKVLGIRLKRDHDNNDGWVSG